MHRVKLVYGLHRGGLLGVVLMEREGNQIHHLHGVMVVEMMTTTTMMTMMVTMMVVMMMMVMVMMLILILKMEQKEEKLVDYSLPLLVLLLVLHVTWMCL